MHPPRVTLTTALALVGALALAACGKAASAAGTAEHPVDAPPAVSKEAFDALETRVMQLELDVKNLKARLGEPITDGVPTGEGGPGGASGDGLCVTGVQQSPVPLSGDDALVASVTNPTFQYADGATTTVDKNAPVMRLDVADGGTLQLEGVTYTLHHIDVHAPAEHSIGGSVAPVEIQLVHDDGTGRLAVVSVMLVRGVQSAPYDPFVRALADGGPVNPAALLPLRTTSYRYAGSLTSAPCTEGVSWMVLDTPVPVSPAQLDEIAGHVPANTSRALQPLGDRVVGLDVTP